MGALATINMKIARGATQNDNLLDEYGQALPIGRQFSQFPGGRNKRFKLRLTSNHEFD